MAQLAHFERTFLDSAGNPIDGATVGIYGQGATIVSGGPNVFVVDDPGSFLVNDAVKYIAPDGTDPGQTTLLVTAVSATGITVSGIGFSSTANNGRLLNAGFNPSIFKDAQGNEAKGTFTTNAQGYADCWLVGQPVDVQTSGGTSTLGAAATHYWFDVTPSGGESSTSNTYSGTVLKRNTLRALVATDVLEDLQVGGTSKFKVLGDGEIVAGAAGATHALTGNTTITGTLTSSGALAVQAGGATITGNSTIAGTLGGLTGLTVSSGGATITGSSTVGGVTLDPSGPTATTAILEVNSISNGQKLTFRTQTELLTIAAAATTNSSITLNTDAVILAVSVRVTVLIPTAATFTVTGNSSGTTFSTAAVAVAAGTTDVGTASCPYKNGAGQLVRITPNLTPADNTGRVRITIHYYDVTPATS